MFKYQLISIYWIKNEAPYIPEYIEFHLEQGYEYFIFYDNDSTDLTIEVLTPYIKDGIAEIRKYPEYVKNLNIGKIHWIMPFSIAEFTNVSKWIHFMSLTERFFCPNGMKISELLREYEDYGGLSVGWKYFNSNGHKTKPKGLIIENYTEAVYDALQVVKTIIQPNKTLPIISNDAHNFKYNNNISVDENYVQVDGAFHDGICTMNKITNYKYVTLSEEEFLIKMNKGLLDVKQENEKRTEFFQRTQWDYTHNPPEQSFISIDTSLHQKYTDLIKARIKKRYKNYEYLLSYINV